VGDVTTPARLPLPKGFKVPDHYDLTSQGVFEMLWKKAKSKATAQAAEAIGLEVEERDDGWYIKSTAEVAPAPVAPVRIFRDFDGNEDVELAWVHRGEVVRRFFPREVVKNGKLLVAQAGPAGFPAISYTATDIERWLFAVETVNDLPVETVARQLGWQPDGTFVAGNGKPYRVRPVHDGMDRIILAHRPEGKLSEWKATIKGIKELPLPQMALYASFAAPLLPLLELTSFIVHFAGLSSRGKTTSAQVGMSVWANPRIDGGAMGEWKGTRVALERRLSLANGLPVVFDETANVSHPNIIKDLIYTIPQGQEKARGTISRMRTTLPWSTVVISTGEASLLSGVREGGAAARVLEIEGTPFGDGGGEIAEAIRAGVEHWYGLAGPAYVEELRKLVQKEEPTIGRVDLRIRHEELTEKFKTGSNLRRRRAPFVAALRLAAELAWEFKVLPFEPPRDAVWEELFAVDAHDDRPGEALSVIWRWISSNRHRLYDTGRRKPEDDSPAQDFYRPPHGGWAGVVRKTDEAVAMNPEEVERILEENGYALDAVKHGWAERGAILRDRANLTCWSRIGPMSEPRLRRFVFVKPKEVGP
jgi:hypothetical protein